MFLPIFPHRVLILIFISATSVSTACSSRTFTTTTSNSSRSNASYPVVNINRADAAALEKLPGVGASLAAKIVDHRERYGPFRKAEHLLVIDGISDKKFREIRDHIAIE